MRVLAISHDWGGGHLRTVRMEMPLHNLLRNGHIERFAVTDRFLRGVDPSDRFDVVWLQRVHDPSLVRTLRQTIQSRYLYDIDDYLLGNDAVVSAQALRTDVIVDAIAACGRLTVTHDRLRDLLQRHTQVDLAPKTTSIPNGAEFPHGLKPDAPPSAVVWVSGLPALLTNSGDAVFGALATFLRRRNIPAYFLGASPPDVGRHDIRFRRLGTMPYWQYVSWLASSPPMIGIAPVETDADPALLAGLSGKSDIKMAEYAGFGHLGVYSDAPSFRDSDLGVGRVVANTADAWLAALEACFSECWKTRSTEQERVIASRHMNRIASSYWLPALESVRLASPARAAEIIPHAGRGIISHDMRQTLNAHSPTYRLLRTLVRPNHPRRMK